MPFLHNRIITAISMMQFISDRIPYVILRENFYIFCLTGDEIDDIIIYTSVAGQQPLNEQYTQPLLGNGTVNSVFLDKQKR
jgi:hypothetical protein